MVPGEFDFAKSSDGETVEEIQTFLEESVKDGCEGLMVKMLETDSSNYEPSRRSINWLKVRCIELIHLDCWTHCLEGEERLPCWGRRLVRSHCRRRILRQRETN